jgi:fructose-1-phosphate kinase PfkB-like protein
MQVDVGGKAINVASCLADFGVSAAVAGQLGRDNAALFEELFQRKQIANHCCYLDGLTRINTKLVDTVSGDTTDLNMPGPELTRKPLRRCWNRYWNSWSDWWNTPTGWFCPAVCRRECRWMLTRP